MTELLGWIAWGLMLMMQNASNTWVSRARNSASLGYHALASVFSNGVWFCCFFIAVDKLTKISGWAFVGTGVFYVACTVSGSVLSHAIVSRFESGKRRVGA